MKVKYIKNLWLVKNYLAEVRQIDDIGFTSENYYIDYYRNKYGIELEEVKAHGDAKYQVVDEVKYLMLVVKHGAATF